MTVGIVGGTGPLGRGLALRLAAAGEIVVIGSRQPERAVAVTAELVEPWPAHSLDIIGAGNAEAAACSLVVMATPWDAAVTTSTSLRDEIGDKVVVSVANALVRQGREMHALVPARGSIAASLQAALPEARVAAACHHLPATTLSALDRRIEADVLVCADDPGAADTTAALIGRIEGLRAVRAGSLASAAAVEAFTAVLVTVNLHYKAHTSLRLAGLADSANPPP
ncbi:MAG TPA: NADPH-dependent F420 reductase [Acidimicrobiales bacterium]|nr:NADPH-dependent F420 reductase [Acidimicrobiales bacterium]